MLLYILTIFANDSQSLFRSDWLQLMTKLTPTYTWGVLLKMGKNDILFSVNFVDKYFFSFFAISNCMDVIPLKSTKYSMFLNCPRGCTWDIMTLEHTMVSNEQPGHSCDMKILGGG